MADRPPLRAALAGIGISALVAWGSRAILPIIGLLVVGTVLVLFLRRKHHGSHSRW